MALRHEELRKIYRFDEFQVDARKQILLRAGKPITLNAKAFHLLLVLVTSGGRELSKDELMQLVWRDQIVEENNLAVHIHNLRKILGERKDQHRYIITIPGLGYRFVAEVNESASEAEVYIESHTVSRLVIEDDDGRNPALREAVIAPATPVYSTKEIPATKSMAIVPLVQSPGRGSVLLGVVLVGLLLAAGLGGYWLYRNRWREVVSPPVSASRQPMTITRFTDGKQIGAPTISLDGRFIVYVENASSGAGTLFVQQTDTNTVLQLLEPDDRVFGCTNFSPDGSLIYYVVFDKRDPYAALYSIPVLGGTPKRIMGNFRPYFSLSPDGKGVAFYRSEPENSRKHLMIAALDGSNEQKLLTRAYNELSFGAASAWSPDGNLIAFSADPEPDDRVDSLTIFGVEVNSGAARPLTTTRFSEIGKMSWTSDGRSLVFVAKGPRKENQLYLMDYPSGETRQLTNSLQTYGNYGLGITADNGTLVAVIRERNSEIWSVGASGDASKAVHVKSGTTNGLFGITTLPDGRIAYIARTGDNLDLWTVKEGGTEAKALTSDSFNQKDIAASPDGRYIVFASDQAGESHIFRMNADDGSEVTQLTFGTPSDSLPDVSPDGEWVVYTSWDGRQSTIWKVPLAGGASRQLTDYESGSPVFAPDGKTIACVLPSDSRVKLANLAIVAGEGGKPIKSFQVMPFGYAYYNDIRWRPDGKALVFRKPTNGISDLWQQPINGDAPKRLTNFQSGSIWNFAYSRDGKRIFLSHGNIFNDVVLIKNFR
jgi:Tol biopolymer transport system component/DNA-binding winged helix-turn-helix (wHTH) protein